MAGHIIETDIVIIGAGYAGIAAAEKLHEAGRNFVVVEARDRIGGRTLTEKLDSGATVDLGAQWIGPDQHLVWDWVKKTNTQTYECYDTGKNILSWKGRSSTYKGTIPKIDPLSLIDLGLALNKLNRLSKQIPLEAPWNHPQAEKLDSMTVASWMDKQMYTQKAKYLFSVGIETVFAAEPSELSMLGALFYSRSGKDMDALLAVTGGAQQTLLNHGTQTLLKKIAEPFTDRIHTDNPVFSIDQTNDHIVIETPSLLLKANHCIITIPPALIDRIRFTPILPQMKAQLYQRIPMGAAMKCFAIYDRPFWRDKGFSGQVVSDEAPVKVTFDCSKSDDSHGIVLAFVEAKDARYFIDVDPKERKKQVLEGLAKHLGKEALEPLEYLDKCWTEEEWSRGCYVGNMPPGVITQFKDTIRQPFGRIRFAGTETATEWNGYLDGAIQSGYREAQVILNFGL